MRQAARSDRLVATAVIVIAVVVAAALLGPLLLKYGPNDVDLANAQQGSSGAHLLGTDESGRDLLSRLIYGARPTLLGTSLIIALAVVVGTTVALASAWIGGWFDAVVSRTLDVGFAFPGLLLAILAVAIFGPGLTAPVIALAVAYVPYIARVIRAVAIRERALPYVSALSIQGASSLRICGRHILPNVLPMVLVQATVSFGYALIDLASLSYLGLGVQPPTADWGTMVANGQLAALAGHAEQSLYAGVLIILTVTAFTVLGERLSANTGRGR